MNNSHKVTALTIILCLLLLVMRPIDVGVAAPLHNDHLGPLGGKETIELSTRMLHPDDFPTITPIGVDSTTAEDLVDALLSSDSGVTVSNVNFVGADSMAALFSNGDTLGFSEGIILSSGRTSGSNGIARSSSSFAISAMGQPVDSDLNALFTNAVKESIVLEFDFVPEGIAASFRFRFGSEEYPEYVGGNYNDVFAFFVNGVNYALVPDTSTSVAVNTVNQHTNSDYYVHNSSPGYGATGNAGIQVVFDGLTTILEFTAPVNPGVTNHIKLTIGDGGDQIYDSAVFIKGGSFTAAPNAPPHRHRAQQRYHHRARDDSGYFDEHRPRSRRRTYLHAGIRGRR